MACDRAPLTPPAEPAHRERRRIARQPLPSWLKDTSTAGCCNRGRAAQNASRRGDRLLTQHLVSRVLQAAGERIHLARRCWPTHRATSRASRQITICIASRRYAPWARSCFPNFMVSHVGTRAIRHAAPTTSPATISEVPAIAFGERIERLIGPDPRDRRHGRLSPVRSPVPGLQHDRVTEKHVDPTGFQRMGLVHRADRAAGGEHGPIGAHTGAGPDQPAQRYRE